MNSLLSLNQKYVFIISILVLVLTIFFLSIKYYFNIRKNELRGNYSISNVDITEPRFSMNNDRKKINITAKEGNFLDNDKILLKKNVKFKSNEFSIISDNVVFDRKKQTASSDEKSTFKSKNTKILSDGFDIEENGKKLKFHGKAKVTLK